jgi:hypothetical protein
LSGSSGTLVRSVHDLKRFSRDCIVEQHPATAIQLEIDKPW